MFSLKLIYCSVKTLLLAIKFQNCIGVEMHGSYDTKDKGLGSMFINFRNEFLVFQKMRTMRLTLHTEIAVYCSKDVNTHPSFSAEQKTSG